MGENVLGNMALVLPAMRSLSPRIHPMDGFFSRGVKRTALPRV